jgi:hypothetical protein
VVEWALCWVRSLLANLGDQPPKSVKARKQLRLTGLACGRMAKCAERLHSGTDGAVIKLSNQGKLRRPICCQQCSCSPLVLRRMCSWDCVGLLRLDAGTPKCKVGGCGASSDTEIVLL